MKKLLTALSITMCIPYFSQAQESRTVTTLLHQIEQYDAAAFKKTFKAASVSYSDQITLLNRAQSMQTALQNKLRHLRSEQSSDIKTAGNGLLLLAISAVMATPVIISALKSDGKISKFLRPDQNISDALYFAMCLADTRFQTSLAYTLLWTSGTFKHLWPTNKYFHYAYHACLYLLCTAGSVVAGYEGGKLLNQVLFATRSITKKLKNIDEIIETLTQNSRIAHAYHTLQGIS